MDRFVRAQDSVRNLSGGASSCRAMSRSRTPLAITLVLFSVGALGFAWWQHAALIRTRAELALAQRRIGELQRSQPTLPVPEMTTVANAAGAPLDAAPDQPPERELGDRRGGPGPGGRFGRALMDLSSDPEIAPLLLNQRKRAAATRYATLLARLGLSPVQTEQLKTLLAEKQLSHSDARMMARSQGLGREDIREMTRLADAESDAALKAMLGDAGFAQLQEYDRTYAERLTVGSLANQLTYAGAPLPTAQQEQLIQILAANTVTASGGGRGASVEESRAYLEAKAVSDAATLRQASAILTPTQLAALQQSQQDANEQLKLNALTVQRLRQLRSEVKSNAPGG